MIEVVPYTKGHGLAIIADQTRDVESWFRETSVVIAEAAMREKENGHAWTLIEDGIPLVAAGFYRFTENKVAEAWYLMSPKGLKHIRGVMRICRNSISAFVEETGFLLVAHVLEEDTGGHSWAKYMGFKSTGELIPDGGHMYVTYQRGE
jgi:hypothetical protein